MPPSDPWYPDDPEKIILETLFDDPDYKLGGKISKESGEAALHICATFEKLKLEDDKGWNFLPASKVDGDDTKRTLRVFHFRKDADVKTSANFTLVWSSISLVPSKKRARHVNDEYDRPWRGIRNVIAADNIVGESAGVCYIHSVPDKEKKHMLDEPFSGGGFFQVIWVSKKEVHPFVRDDNNLAGVYLLMPFQDCQPIRPSVVEEFLTKDKYMSEAQNDEALERFTVLNQGSNVVQDKLKLYFQRDLNHEPPMWSLDKVLTDNVKPWREDGELEIFVADEGTADFFVSDGTPQPGVPHVEKGSLPSRSAFYKPHQNCSLHEFNQVFRLYTDKVHALLSPFPSGIDRVLDPAVWLQTSRLKPFMNLWRWVRADKPTFDILQEKNWAEYLDRTEKEKEKEKEKRNNHNNKKNNEKTNGKEGETEEAEEER